MAVVVVEVSKIRKKRNKWAYLVRHASCPFPCLPHPPWGFSISFGAPSAPCGRVVMSVVASGVGVDVVPLSSRRSHPGCSVLRAGHVPAHRGWS